MKSARRGDDEPLPPAKKALYTDSDDGVLPLLDYDSLGEVGRRAPDLRTYLALCHTSWRVRRHTYDVRRLVAWLSRARRERPPPAGLDLPTVFGLDRDEAQQFWESITASVVATNVQDVYQQMAYCPCDSVWIAGGAVRAWVITALRGSRTRGAVVPSLSATFTSIDVWLDMSRCRAYDCIEFVNPKWPVELINDRAIRCGFDPTGVQFIAWGSSTPAYSSMPIYDFDLAAVQFAVRPTRVHIVADKAQLRDSRFGPTNRIPRPLLAWTVGALVSLVEGDVGVLRLRADGWPFGDTFDPSMGWTVSRFDVTFFDPFMGWCISDADYRHLDRLVRYVRELGYATTAGFDIVRAEQALALLGNRGHPLEEPRPITGDVVRDVQQELLNLNGWEHGPRTSEYPLPFGCKARQHWLEFLWQCQTTGD